MPEKKIGWGIIEILFAGGCLLSSFLIVYRLFFGIEFTDEAFTVSDTLSIIHGNIPYTYDTVIVAGQSFVPLLLYKVYELFVPSFAGVFLYSRLTYTFFRFLIIIYVYKVLSDSIERRWRLLIAGLLIVFSGGIPDWGYNETSAYVMLFNTFFIQRTLSKKYF